MNPSMRHFVLALLFLTAFQANADVMYQCVDESGHKSFSNVKSSRPGDRCTAMDIGGGQSSPPPAAKPAAKAPTPAAFPRVDDSSQRARDNDRRRILENELAAEQRNLDQANKDLAEQEGIVLPNERMQFKGGGGISGGKVEERLQPFKDKVALHQRNIEAIQREISKLR
jgi:hypothetical protein